jgi:hypothetical protein
MPAKTIGYSLLTFGIVVIILSALNAYLVLTRQAKPISYITSSATTLNITGIPAISTKDINEAINLSVHLLLLSIISGAGFRLASLGVMLIRPIEVKLIDKSHDSKTNI